MKLIKNRPFTAKITVDYPAVEGGVEQSFTGHFIALPMKELEKFNIGTVEDQDTFLERVFVGWSGLLDDRDGEGVPLEFSAEARAMLLDDLFLRRAVLETYSQTLAGVRRGN